MATIRIPTAAFALFAATALSGCYIPPPPVAVLPQQVPYVAIPGPGNTQAQFGQDDLTCRAAAAQLPPGPGVTRGATGTATGTAVQPTVAPLEPEPPGVTYFRCMASRSNLIEPMPQSAPPVLYASYAPYPVYVGGYGDYYPWLYGPGYFGLGFYGGYGFGYGFRGGYGYGFRGGYGYGGYGGGFRGGYGYGGGFHGGYGGGFGGGYGGGFHGGGGGGGGFHR